jgi:tricorn protease interacting factor F2/3
MSTAIRPLAYHLHLEPDLDGFVFSGRVEIEMTAAMAIDTITLDCLDLAVHTCERAEGNTWRSCNFKIDPNAGELMVSLPAPQTGDFRLRIAYTGQINDLMAGFYRSKIQTADGERYIAVTQFQENDARRALPCFDHPSKKATFQVTMVTDDNLKAISNTLPESETVLDDGRRQVVFQPTPAMSTYLLFLGLGPFSWVTDTVDKRVRGAALPGKADEILFGLTFGRKALAYGEGYFGIAYPLLKLDLIAVPDFAFGAMENWGAITFRENLLLCAPDKTPRGAKARICEVIAHEIAHQWFGNLVTPSDWKYLWLNESFATYFGFGIVDRYYANWKTWHHFIRTQTETALARDALNDTVAIEMPGGSAVAINTSTAPIIYSKGGSILRQVEAFIGPEHFQQGLRYYLEKYAYGCAASHQLWEALETVSSQPVNALMRSWVEQPGHPQVLVERNGNRLILTQNRFTYLSNDSDQQWLIPVSVHIFGADGQQKIVTTLLDGRAVSVDLPADTTAYKLNADHTGFHRTHYLDQANLMALAQMVRNRRLETIDRWGLQNDLFAMVVAGHVTLEQFLEFAAHYQHETDFLPLSSLEANLFNAFLVLDDDHSNRCAQTATDLIENTLNTIGIEPGDDEPQPMSVLRDQLLFHGLIYGSQTVMTFLSPIFESMVNGGQSHPDLMRSVMTAGAFFGSQETLEWFQRRLETSQSEHERLNILTALGQFSDWRTQARALNYTLSHVPDRNRYIPIASAAANPNAAPFIWRWFQENLQQAETMHPLLFERVVAALVPAAGLYDPEAVTDFCTRYAHSNPDLQAVIGISLERLRINQQFRGRS